MTRTPRNPFGAASASSLVFVLSLAVWGCSAPPPAETQQEAAPVAAAAPTVPPATSINALMVAMIDNASHVLWDVEKKGFEPKNDADWVELEDHAIQLQAASALIQMGGTGPMDANWVQMEAWRKDAALMGSAAGEALAAAKSRDLAAVVKANGTLVTSCEGCHKAFKPTLPTEGVTHQSPHSESHEGGE